MKVLVTGAAGFIGRHVVKALHDANHETVTLDNTWLNQKWHEAGDIDLSVDITNPIAPMEGIDAIIHLAAMSNPRECDAVPSKAYDVNVNGTQQVLKMALESGVKKVVYASTAHVYGVSPKYLPTPESHPLWLQNNYTITKILGEQLCELYYQNHGLSYTTLRLFNAYGPDQAAGYFIPDMLAKAKGGRIDLPGGNTTKDWVYVEEAAQAFVLALDTPFVGPINIGTGIETALSVIAERIACIMGATYQIFYSEGATRMQADIQRAQSILGWEPEVVITDGLDRILHAEGIKVLDRDLQVTV